MMVLLFDRRKSCLLALAEGAECYSISQHFRAANNVDSKSKGPWPPGVYRVDATWGDRGLCKPDQGEDDQYGRWFVRFVVPDRTGMGIHAGRATRADGLGRVGHQHATMGCIRTTPEAMEFLSECWPTNPVTEVWVR